MKIYRKKGQIRYYFEMKCYTDQHKLYLEMSYKTNKLLIYVVILDNGLARSTL